MNTKTAAQALEELREAGLLDSDHLCIRAYVRTGDIGKLTIDIQNGQNSLSPTGKEEQRYSEIVEHLTRDDIVALGQLLRDHYFKSL
jgi:uridine phosphorylase